MTAATTTDMRFPTLAMLQTISGQEIVGAAIYPNPQEMACTTSFLVGAPTVVNTHPEDYTLVLSDTGSIILHPSTDNNQRTFVIPANSVVQYPVGTRLIFINEMNTVFIAINGGDTLALAGTTATGTRTLASFGICTAVKTAATRWMISGANLT